MKHKSLDKQSAARQFRVQFTNQTQKQWNLVSCQCLHGIYDAQFPVVLNPNQRIKINNMSNGFMTGAEFCFYFKMIDHQLSFSGVADNPYIGKNKIALAKGKLDHQHMLEYLDQKSPKKLLIGKIGHINYYATFSYIKGDKTHGDLRITQQAHLTSKALSFS